MDSKPESAAGVDKYRSALSQARDTISRLMAENQALKVNKPIAISGVSCRFPGGANSVSAFWDLLASGKDGITTVDDQRWPVNQYLDADPEAPGRMYTARAGLISQPVDLFDASFFGISPREAAALDPQQRLLMETSWEALEDAGIIPDSLSQTRAGFFVGMSGDDYARLHRHSGHSELIDAYSLTGSTMSTAAGRLSYFYGTKGPSLTLDTACSSSLVALHLAVRSLRSGESDIALVGASNLILLPEVHVAFCRLGALSPDGACKTFSADANGYVRSEGGGFVVLERLEDAQQYGRRIHGVVEGSAINQDGRTAGLSAPNAKAQEAVILEAIRDAGISPSDIDYVEAHGTGTHLGDPIEVEALMAALGQHRERPIKLGSVKSNIGHMEPAAGLGGLIKILLALKHNEIPANLHFDRPNPLIDWAHAPLQVVSTSTRWMPEDKRPRRAGLSAFGFSGTNAHIILAEHLSQPDPRPASPDPIFTLECSARSQKSLRDQAKGYLEFIHSDRANIGDICASAHLHRSRFALWKGFSGRHAADISSRIQSFLDNDTGHPTVSPPSPSPPKCVWLFTGQGAQYAGMGAELYANDQVFRTSVDTASKILAPFRDVLISDLITGDCDDERIHQTQYSQLALFVLEYALAQRWLHWGFTPGAVLGHSVGEYVAACIAGIISLEDALKLVEYRSRLMGSLPPGGAMAALRMPETAVLKALEASDPQRQIDIAAVNGKRETVISGPSGPIAAFCEMLQRTGEHATALKVSHAFHSHLMEPMLAEFAKAFESVKLHPPKIPMALNLDGSVDPVGPTRPAYWCRQIRSTIRFAECQQGLKTTGHNVFLELGPQPVLTGLVKDAADSGITALATLKREQSSLDGLALAHEGLLAAGVLPESRQRYPAYSYVDLPLYPFDRKRYWADQGHRYALNPSDPTALADDRCQTLVWKDLDPLPTASHGHWLLAGTDHMNLAQTLKHSSLRISTASGDPDAILAAFSAEKPTGLVLQVGAGPESIESTVARLAFTRSLVGNLISRNLVNAVWVLGDPKENPLSLNAHRGLMQTLLLEHPKLMGGTIEIRQDQAELLEKVLLRPGLSGWFRTSQQTLQYPTLAPLGQVKRSLNLESVMISGGLGGIGLSLAAALPAQGCRQLCLIGRRPPDAATSVLLDDLREKGLSIETHQFDVADASSVAKIRMLASKMPHGTFFHCAGVLPMAGADDLTQAFAGKVQGGLNIADALAALPEITLVLMGSVSAVTGTPGISAYGAANAALVGVGEQRKPNGRVLCINWGPWASGGIISASGRQQADLGGFREISTVHALTSLAGIPHDAEHICIVSADWEKVADSFSLKRPLPLFETVSGQMPDSPNPRAAPQMPSVLTGLTPSDQPRALLRLLQEALNSILGLAEHENVDPDQGFFDQGMDSVKALEFRESIDEILGLRLEATDIFDYPSLSVMVPYLLSLLNPEQTDEVANEETAQGVADIEGLSEADLAALIDAEFQSTQQTIQAERQRHE